MSDNSMPTTSSANSDHQTVSDLTHIETPSEDLEKDSDDEISGNSLECAICLQTCIHPVRLPCTHVFCYLCVKGGANHSKRCALCRSEIPVDFLFRPALLNADEVTQTPHVFDGKFQWFYEGVRGWWQYDVRTSAEIEARFQKGEKVVEMLIAGFLYVVDMDNMIQYRRNNPTRRRRIKRDLVNIPDKKGIAGLACRRKVPRRSGGDGGEKLNGQQVLPSTSNGQSTSSQSNAAASAGPPADTVATAQRSQVAPVGGDEPSTADLSDQLDDLSISEASGTSRRHQDESDVTERQIIDGLSDSD